MTYASVWRVLVGVAVFAASVATSDAQNSAANRSLQSPRLYVLDGGILASDPARYRLTDEEVQTTALSIAAYLIVHPRGVLLWDTGAVPDYERVSAGSGSEQRLVLADSQERRVTLGPSIASQLMAIGYVPADVTHLALSHYHWDHTANANAFAHATWLARQAERDFMFADGSTGTIRPATYAALRSSETIPVTAEEHDVFGDGTVMMKLAAGHTPAHQVLYVKLANTGGVVLSGDLYHYPEERTLNRLPTRDFNVEQTDAARQELEAFLTRMDAVLWIQHDLIAHRALKKAPEYYD